VSELEIVAAVLSAAAVFLGVRQSLWNWPLGIVSVLLYVAVFVRARLYADAGLQIVYAAMNAYGWYEWRFGGVRRTALPLSRTPARLWPLLAGLAVVGSLLLGWLFARFTNAALPYVDSALAATSLVAQWMMTRKLLEHWLVWIAVDLVYVPMYASQRLYPTTALYAVFLGLAVSGYFAWRRDWRAAHDAAPLRAAA
jgi:nicotinamide mononucleotide transporter